MGLPPHVEKKVHRQAAVAVGKLLEADEKKKGGVSIKTLTLKDDIIAKKATYALTCETLRYLTVIKQVLESTTQLRFSQHLRPELAYVLVYDLLFGQGLSGCAPPEQVVLACKSALRSSLARLLVKNGVSSAAELLPAESQKSDSKQPRYARVNTLKVTLDNALSLLQPSGGPNASPPKVAQDPLIRNLLTFPPGTDLHAHPMVKDGRLILQGKASCMPAEALNPNPSWTVIDACAAPGNKTVHLSALMGNKGKVLACDAVPKRVKILRRTVEKAGAKNVDVRHQDFLKLDPDAPEFAKVRAILLDPSCSGSGTRLQRMDHLLPSNSSAVPETKEKGDARSPYEPATPEERERVEKLAGFQGTALRHALRSRHLVRTDASRDQMDGFFVALFEKGSSEPSRLSDDKGTPAAEPAQKTLRADESVTEIEQSGKSKKRKGRGADASERIKKSKESENGDKNGSQTQVGGRESEGDLALDPIGGPARSLLAEQKEDLVGNDNEHNTVEASSAKARESLLRRRKAKRERKKERLKGV